MVGVLEEFVSLGGDGIERDYAAKDSIPKNTRTILNDFVKKHSLAVSGGTDFHEKKEGGGEIGDLGITPEEFGRLKKCWKDKQREQYI